MGHCSGDAFARRLGRLRPQEDGHHRTRCLNRSSVTSARSGGQTARPTTSPAGIGDMAGDVFGNGMLLSEHTQLVGAFNHMYIFVGPDLGCGQELRRAVAPVRNCWPELG